MGEGEEGGGGGTQGQGRGGGLPHGHLVADGGPVAAREAAREVPCLLAGAEPRYAELRHHHRVRRVRRVHVLRVYEEMRQLR